MRSFFLSLILALAFLPERTAAQEVIFLTGMADYDNTERDPPLNENGHRQAQAWARELAAVGIDAVFASTRRRSQQTAEPIASANGLEVVTMPKDATQELVTRLKRDHANDQVFVTVHDAYIWPFLREYGYSGIVPSIILRDLLIIVPRAGEEPAVIHLRLE